MPTKAPDISDLSVSEKIALMEQLWESMSLPNDSAEPPAWHESVLREREAEWGQRHAVSQDWEEAKEEIRKQTR